MQTIEPLKSGVIATVYSSHGEIKIDFCTGIVLENNTGEEYDDIHRFNLSEWCNYWKSKHVMKYVILDLGGWNKEGKEFPPETTYRQRIANYNKRS